MRAIADRRSDAAQERARGGSTRAEVDPGQERRGRARERVERVDLVPEARGEIAQGGTELRRFREQPEELVNLPKAQERGIALDLARVRKRVCRALPGAVAVVDRAPTKAARAEVGVDRATGRGGQVTTALAGGLVAREIFGRFEGGRDAA